MRRLARRGGMLALVAATAVVTSAHVGSPNVFFDGMAGPYQVHVVVRPPAVVPGVAQVLVRVNDYAPLDVVIRPVFWRASVAGAPSGDKAKPVCPPPAANNDHSAFCAAAGSYTGQLWLMARGAYSVYVTVSGTAGSGTVIVPVVSRATARLSMGHGLGVLLVLLGALLLAGLVSIVYAAAGESLEAPGTTHDAARTRVARVAAAVSLPILVVAVLGGARWWSSVDRAYQRTLYAPPPAIATVRLDSGRRVLQLAVADRSGNSATLSPRADPSWAQVMPDHGKMIHLFLIRDPDMGVMAHLHPVMTGPATFTTVLPNEAELPAGRYRVYGDVVFERGDDRTLTATVDIPASLQHGKAAPSDSDDVVFTSAGTPPLVAADGAKRGAAHWSEQLADGSTLVQGGDQEPYVTDKDTRLAFVVLDNGQVARLQPYMGMAAHAVVASADGSVFIHLHPMGSVSTAAQDAFQLRDKGDTNAKGRLQLGNVAQAGSMAMPGSLDGAVSIPYAFPKPGRYRVWIQVKRGGKILTGVFDTDVH